MTGMRSGKDTAAVRTARTAPVALLMWLSVLAASSAAITLVSVEDEIEIGRQAQAQVKSQVPELRDRPVTAYVAGIGRRLAARAQGPQYPYTFSVANYSDLNAFALPGGPVWVHRGVIEAAQTEAQFASVVGHEIAHIAQRHAADQLTKAFIADGLLGLLGAALGEGGGARSAEIAARLFTGGLFLKFSRDDEREADRVGTELIARAGWDPHGAAEFMQVLRSHQGRDPGSVEIFLSSHPSPEGRVQDLQQIADRLGSGRRDSSAFQDVRRRLARMPPAPSVPRR